MVIFPVQIGNVNSTSKKIYAVGVANKDLLVIVVENLNNIKDNKPVPLASLVKFSYPNSLQFNDNKVKEIKENL